MLSMRFIVSRTSLSIFNPCTDQEHKQWLLVIVAKWQVPDDAVFVDALPIGAMGKVVKHQLREQFKGHHGQLSAATA